MYNMLSIPVSARLTDEKGMKRHDPTVRKSPAAPGGPIGAPLITEQERISQLRRQRWQNQWKSAAYNFDVAADQAAAQAPAADNNDPSP